MFIELSLIITFLSSVRKALFQFGLKVNYHHGKAGKYFFSGQC